MMMMKMLMTINSELPTDLLSHPPPNIQHILHLLPLPVRTVVIFSENSNLIFENHSKGKLAQFDKLDIDTLSVKSE